MKNSKKVIALIMLFSSLVTIFVLLTFFSDIGRFLWGWNITRNILILLLPILILFLSLLKTLPIPTSFQPRKMANLFFDWVEKYLPVLFLLICLFFEGILFIFFAGLPIQKDILRKCIPDFLLIIILLCGTAIAKTVAAYSKNISPLKKINLLPALLFGAILLLFFINFKLTGLTFVIAAQKYFGAGAHLILIQAIFAINSGLLCFFLFKCIQPKKSFYVFLDIFLFVVLFVSAYFYWNQLKIPLNFFMRPLDSQTIAPYSDSRVYDLNGLGFAFGQGIGFGYPAQKPFYSFFLGVLHLLFGQNYPLMISGQVLVLSLMPSLYYLVSKQFLNRGIGLAGALLVIFKEYNLVILSSESTQSSVKMLMTDCFATLFILLLVLVTFLWINKPTSKKLAVLTGVCLSVTALIRLQMAAFIPIYLVVYLIAKKPRKFNLKGPLTLFIVGVTLVLLPWMTRNLIRSGQFVIEQPEYVNFSFIPDKTFSQTQTGSDESLSNSPVQLIGSITSGYLQPVSSYLNNSLMSTLYQLPTNYRRILDLEAAIHSGQYSYPFPYQELSSTQNFIWGLNILVIFLGIIFCWYRFKWKSLFPLAFYLAFALIISFAGYSGWRFIQPVDWVVFIYWCAGLFGLVELMWGDFVLPQNEEPIIQRNVFPSEKGLFPILIMALLIGLLLPISELLVPSTLQLQTKQEVFAQITSEITSVKNDASKLAADPMSTVQTGKALYPVYVHPGDDFGSELHLGFFPYPNYYTKYVGDSDSKISDQISAGNTILFFTLANSSVQEVYLFNPKNISPAQSGEDTTVIGCDRGDFIQAYWVKIGNSIIESADGIPPKCPQN